MDEIPENIRAGALEYWNWYRAFRDVGFSAKQAFALCIRPMVNIQPSQYPPEFMEAMERQTALANKMMVELDE